MLLLSVNQNIMAAMSPVLQITQKICQLRSIPNRLLNPKYILIFIFTIIIVLTVYYHSKNNDLDIVGIHDFDLQGDLEEVKVNKSSLIIFTRYRSGSSLIGELFNRHPDVFFIFEPFKVFPMGLDWNSFIRSQASGYLFELNRCNFQAIINDSISLPNAQKHLVKSWIHRAFCGKTKITLEKTDDLKCRRGSLNSIEQLCHNYSLVVTKTIRIYDITVLVPYLQRDHKVISLLRDPRGMISSRIKIEQIRKNQSDDQYFRDMGLRLREAQIKAESACRDIRENLQATGRLVNEVPEFQKLYYAIRYEDFAENPVEQAKSLYRFAGLNFHQSVHEWLLSATSGVEPTQQKPGSLSYSFSTNRGSSIQTANAWRLHLPYRIVKRIQKVCYKELVILGYIPVNSTMELTDMDVKLYQNFSFPWF